MKAVFLDRDGVVNELVYHRERGIIDSPFTLKQFRLLPGVPEAIRHLHQANYLVVVVSNQPGIAKGHMSHYTFNKIKSKLKSELHRAGVALDGEYYCLHHPEAIIEQYRVVCDCRKPKPGLLEKATQDLKIDLAKSWLIGDNLTDVKAGQSAGCQTILLSKMKCELCNLMDDECIRPDIIKPSLLEAVQHILDNGG